MSCIYFYLNKNKDKTAFDRIMIRSNKDCDHANSDSAFTAFYKGDVTNDTVRTKVPENISLGDSHDVLDYVEDLVDLIMTDIDDTPYVNMDVMIPGYPVVALTPNNDTKTLILRVVRNWCKRMAA